MEECSHLLEIVTYTSSFNLCPLIIDIARRQKFKKNLIFKESALTFNCLQII